MASTNAFVRMINIIKVSAVAKKGSCVVPNSKLNRKVLDLLHKHGYINGWSLGIEENSTTTIGKCREHVYRKPTEMKEAASLQETCGFKTTKKASGAVDQDIVNARTQRKTILQHLTVGIKYASGVPVLTRISMPQGQTPSTPRQASISHRNMNNNVTSTYILSTDKGLQLSTTALKNRTGGVILCSIY